MSGDRIHQRRRQAVIGLKPEFLEARSDPRQLRRIDAGLDHRGYEGCKSRSRRAGFLEQFGMDEVEAVERMPLVLDAAEHVGPANLAGMPLDRCRSVDDVKLVAVLKNAHVVARHNGDHRKDRALRLPAFGAATGMVVGDIPLDADLDRLLLAFADKGATGKAARAFLHSGVNRWVDMNSHGLSSLCLTLFDLERDFERDDFSPNRHPAPSFCLSMIFFGKTSIHFSGSCSRTRRPNGSTCLHASGRIPG